MSASEPRNLKLLWLERLRWASIAAQVAVALGVELWLEMPLPLGWLALVVALEASVNLGSGLLRRRISAPGDALLAGFLAVDLLLFTAVLYFTGGTSNPFSPLYLMVIAVAAHILPPRWSFALAAFSSACFAALFFDHVSLPFEDHHHHEELGWYQRGAFVALAAAAGLTVYLISRARKELLERERELERVRHEAARRERLASLATLAAGAAHELGSPLSTIAVAAGELEKELERRAGLEDAAADAGLIRAQVERCRAVLEQLAADAGQSPVAALSAVELGALVDEACSGVAARERIRVVLPERRKARLPVKSVTRALRGVIQNALDAAENHEVTVRCDERSGELWITVTDSGPGMSPEVLQRAEEPFFTTKGSRGMGLGLFLARTVTEELGGGLQIASELGRGTEVTLRLPLLGAR